MWWFVPSLKNYSASKENPLARAPPLSPGKHTELYSPAFLVRTNNTPKFLKASTLCFQPWVHHYKILHLASVLP